MSEAKIICCPVCKKNMKPVTVFGSKDDPTEALPQMVVLCYECAAVLFYDDDLSVMAVTPQMMKMWEEEEPGVSKAINFTQYLLKGMSVARGIRTKKKDFLNNPANKN